MIIASASSTESSAQAVDDHCGNRTNRHTYHGCVLAATAYSFSN